jgi:S-adenosylmethionine hydrolase
LRIFCLLARKDFNIIRLSILVILIVPDEGYYLIVPDEGYYLIVPDEGYYLIVPDEGYYLIVPDEGKMTRLESLIILKSLGARKQKGLNRIDKIG